MSRSPFDLSGRVALVTGGNRGIGRAIAEALAGAGADVAVSYHAREADALETRRRIERVGRRGLAIQADVSKAAEVDRLVGTVERELGRVDILVNNAGITKDQLMLRLKRDDWDAVIGTNLTATFVLTQLVLKQMIRQRSGRIISISSVVGQSGNAGQANYAASKAGLIGFSKAVALEVASRGITVNVIAPGIIDTDMTRAVSGKAHVSWTAQIPLGRLGTTDDVAAAACFLASDEAAYITGHVLAVNGGMYM